MAIAANVLQYSQLKGNIDLIGKVVGLVACDAEYCIGYGSKLRPGMRDAHMSPFGKDNPKITKWVAAIHSLKRYSEWKKGAVSP